MKRKDERPEDYIYRLIKDQIIKKELFPNSQIIESQLAKDTGISRTPIRAALNRLNYEGIVTIIPNRGAFVSNPTADEIKSAYECKKLLESAAIRLACVNITDEQLDFLEDLVNQGTDAHIHKNLSQFMKVNDEFHMTIAKASKNIFYEKYIGELIQRNNVYLIFYDNFMFTSTNDSDALKEHGKILDLLKERDVEGCVKAIEEHNQITLDQLRLSGLI